MQRQQDSFFTPVYIGSLLNPAELLWAAEKENYKRSPVEERESDKQTLETLLGCLKNRFEVPNSIHKPALYTQTMLLSAQDGENVFQKRGADVIGGEKARKTLLLPDNSVLMSNVEVSS